MTHGSRSFDEYASLTNHLPFDLFERIVFILTVFLVIHAFAACLRKSSDLSVTLRLHTFATPHFHFGIFFDQMDGEGATLDMVTLGFILFDVNFSFYRVAETTA